MSEDVSLSYNLDPDAVRQYARDQLEGNFGPLSDATTALNLIMALALQVAKLQEQLNARE